MNEAIKAPSTSCFTVKVRKREFVKDEVQIEFCAFGLTPIRLLLTVVTVDLKWIHSRARSECWNIRARETRLDFLFKNKKLCDSRQSNHLTREFHVEGFRVEVPHQVIHFPIECIADSE